MRKIVSARPLPGYKLHLRFDDGAEGEADLSDLVGQGVFEAWRDHAAFAAVFVEPESGTVTWPGGIDLDPDRLYSEITGAPLPGTKSHSTAG